ncbi:MAG: PhoU domain-containing protein [Candidatus Marinimicrobia bacterium]|nr:PhoU domain-containing protein [Candidatus Neomarinimicrobiota bacterium]
MSVFKDLVNIWKSEDNLSQAWNESNDMLHLSHEMFNDAVDALRSGEKNKVLKSIKLRDEKINNYHREIRKKVVTYYSVSKDVTNIDSGLVLINIVVDIERIGDYSKNILDLAKHYPKKFVSEKFSDDLRTIEKAVIERFSTTVGAVEDMDEKIANDLLSTYRDDLGKISDDLVASSISGKVEIGKENKTASVALYARYLKRIGAHLKNITTAIINPFESVGYNE